MIKHHGEITMNIFPQIAIMWIVCCGIIGCSQEQQNKLGRAVQNWTGTNGVLEIYAGEKLVKRFLSIDKISTATATSGSEARSYRFGYGILDENLNGVADQGEKMVYFEISDFSTPYIFYESPR
jgi:hypothetical protein